MYNTCYIGNHSKRTKMLKQYESYLTSNYKTLNCAYMRVKIWFACVLKSAMRFSTRSAPKILGRNSNEIMIVYDTIYFKFFTLTSLTAERLSFVQVTTDRKLDWIVPDRTRSYQVKPDRRFLDLLRYKILSYIFTIFNIWRNQSKCSARNAKKC